MLDVLILAAGRGQRLRPLTDATPKALLQVGGKALLEHHLQRLAALGVGRVVVNLAWLGGQIRDYFADERRRFGLDLQYSEEPEGALETGGGIVNALGHLTSDPFMVINADILCDFSYADLSADPLDMHLILVPNPPHHPQGDFCLVDGRLQAAGNGANPTWTYAGIGCFRRRVFDGLRPGRFPLLPVIEQAMAEGRAGGQVHHGQWSDLGSPERLAQARRRHA